MEAGDEDRVMEAAELFDNPLQKDAVKRFLDDPTHHLVIAYSHGVPVGFVSGVEVTHPDKGLRCSCTSFRWTMAIDTTASAARW